jgi:hypothetical protein
VPAGLDFDYVNLDALEARFRVEDGDLLAGAARYRVLYLGGSSVRLTVRALRRLVELVEQGATIVGPQPTGSPSLADDAEHARLCDRLWGAGGAVLDTDDLAAALDRLGVRPRLEVDGPGLLRIGRRIGTGEVTFLANPQPRPVVATLRSAPGEPLVAWDPVSLRRWALEEVDGGAHLLRLPAVGSVVVVEGGAADPAETAAGSETELDGEWRLTLPGVGEFRLPEGPRFWTGLGPAAAAFAGTGTYATQVDVPDEVPERGPVVLVAGDVGDVAAVRVNGVDCGVAWTEPFAVDVTAAVRRGHNTVEIDVANAWMNRLIAEAASPTGEVFPPVAGVYAPDAPVRSSGLAGPVVLRVGSRPQEPGGPPLRP